MIHTDVFTRYKAGFFYFVALFIPGHVHEKKALNMTAVFYQTARVQV
jgi:hypothetical protein